ncbi:DUF4190 domain-containing protein [Mycolicibacterium mageritense]|uniref:DUF4190 domain-containing protein n=1 Tax=Mycolicibacterium mageritense TaxID=53462 RepID=UPI001E3C6CCA|nr:DUF4190 domain-containing protein [Mycolicibacterium mageritense]GJJ18358.1 hypothetical protein MTY414_20310 [Mycolicibacterium mageritense]
MTGESDTPKPPPTPPVPPSPYGAYGGGYPPPPPPPYGAYQPQAAGPRNGLGIAALVTAIVGLLLVWSVLGGLILGLVAIILGFVGRGRCKRGEADNSGVATTGIVLGFIAMVISVAFVVVYFTVGAHWFNEVGGRDYVSCLQEAGNDQAAQQQCEETFQKRLEDEFGVTPTPTR